MIDARIIEPDKNEILRYLGWKGTGPTPVTDDRINLAVEQLMKTARPKLVYRILPADAGGISLLSGLAAGPEACEPVVGQDNRNLAACPEADEPVAVQNIRKLPAIQEADEPAAVQDIRKPAAIQEAGEPTAGGSRDLAGVLAGCSEICIFAATLGSLLDALIDRKQVSDMSEALLLEAVSNAAIENVCDNFENDLRKHLKETGKYLSDRVSPGYGDISLAIQKEICDILNSFRRIGLTVTDTCMMIPRKSVTAIAGISRNPDVYTRKGCESCNMYGRCDYSCRLSGRQS